MPRLLLSFLILGLFPGKLLAQEANSDAHGVALHAGLAYAGLPDSDFEVVSSVGGQDLFAQVEDEEKRTDLVAFLSHSIARDLSGVADLWLTLGTALEHPGSTLYFGPSVGVSRALLTAGMSTAMVERGLDPAPDQVFRGSGDRNLYALLERTREWGYFIALTFSLIQ